jgi:hypothetical protein
VVWCSVQLSAESWEKAESAVGMWDSILTEKYVIAVEVSPSKSRLGLREGVEINLIPLSLLGISQRNIRREISK